MIYLVDSSDKDRLEESKQTFGTGSSIVRLDGPCDCFRSMLLGVIVSLLLSPACTYIWLLFADKMINNDSLRGVPLLLLANKQDLQVDVASFC